MSITVKYGSGNSLTKTFPVGTTVDGVLKNDAIKGALGFGNNVEGHVDGVPQTGSTSLRDGITLAVYDKACQKAA